MLQWWRGACHELDGTVVSMMKGKATGFKKHILKLMVTGGNLHLGGYLGTLDGGGCG